MDDLKSLQKNYDDAVKLFNNAPHNDLNMIETAIYKLDHAIEKMQEYEKKHNLKLNY